MQESILEFKNISKSFGVINALSDISFDVRRGEILGLLGANGAGKSTLLKILGGIQSSDAGEIFLDGFTYTPKSAHEAKSKGVVSVYQELNMFNNMTVAENLFVGNENTGRTGLIDWKKTFRRANELLSSMGLGSINAKDLVENLSVANRQIVEIARAINEKPSVLLLDEPTASLSEEQISWLFEQVNRIVANGTTVIYISHRLDEVLGLCDRCVVLRDGKLASLLEKEEISREAIVFHMVGREIKTLNKSYKTSGLSGKDSGNVVLECEHLSLPGAFNDITLRVHSGEILGIAGLVGSGRSELLKAIYGVTPAVSGSISIKGKYIPIRHTKQAVKASISLVSEDRKKEGLFMPESAQINFAAATIQNRAQFGFIHSEKERKEVTNIADDVQFDSSRLDGAVELLSGGNQQKVVIGKNLLTRSKILLLDEPTRGVDVGARSEIYEIIKQSAAEGKAVLLVSSDWEELTMLADRAVVMSEGHLVGELEGEDITPQNIMHLCTVYKTTETEETKQSVRDRLIVSFSKNKNTYVLASLLLILMALGPMLTPFFFRQVNFNNIMWQTMVFVLLTFGQLAVVISGGIDLSLSACMTVASVIGIKFMLAFPDLPALGLIAMLGVGLLIGAINGVIVVYGKVDSFIGTLAIQMILQGTALILTPVPIGPAPGFLRQIANGRFLNYPIVMYIGIIIFVLFWIFYQRTRFGRYIYAVGESQEGASWLGLRVKSVKITAYILCSMMGVVAAYYMLGRSVSAEPVVNNNMMLNSVAYALIGGGTLAGGKGSLSGSVLAAFVITVLMNILNHSGVNRFTQNIIRGVVIMIILILYERRKKSSI